jgi:hypothetical protein
MRIHSFIGSSFVACSVFLAGCAGSFADDGEQSAPPPVTSVDPQAAVHLKGGKNALPAFVDEGLELSAAGSLSGLGNADLLVHLTAEGDAFSTCTNPAGATQPPGQNPADVTLSGTQAIPASEIKNGTVKFSLSTGAPASPIVGAPGCPSSQWAQTIDDVTFSSARIVVEQGGATVLTLSCTFSPSTVDGAVAGQTITCGQN